MSDLVSPNPLPGAAAPSRGRPLMVAACVAIFVWGAIDALLGTILPELVRRAHLTNALAGDISLLYGLGLVIASLVVGPILDRHGKKVVFVPAMFLIAISLVGMRGASSFGAIAGFAFGMGVGGSAVVTAAQALVSDLHDTGRAAALNLLNFFFGFGSFLTPIASGPLDRMVGGTSGSGILWALAIVCVVAALLDGRVAFPPPSPPVQEAARPALWRDPQFWLPVAILFFYVGVETSIWFWQVVYWTRGFGVTTGMARLGVSLFAVAIMGGRLLSQWVLRRLTARSLLLWGAGGMFVFLWAMRAAPTFAASLVLLVMAGIFMAVVYPTALGVVGSRFAGASGTPIGLAVTAGWIGTMAIPPLVGYIGGAVDLAGGYRVLIAAAGLLLVCEYGLFRHTRGGGAGRDGRAVRGASAGEGLHPLPESALPPPRPAGRSER